jgi:hypothetical protein
MLYSLSFAYFIRTYSNREKIPKIRDAGVCPHPLFSGFLYQQQDRYGFMIVSQLKGKVKAIDSEISS